MPLQQHPLPTMRKKILLLHGSRQMGELLLGRMDKLRKRLDKRHNIELVPITAPFVHPDDADMRQWWDREGDSYRGLLEESIPLIQEHWTEDFIGILGFSQGARLAHLCCLAHSHQPDTFLPGLQCAILVAGYEAPLPPDFEQVYTVPTDDSHHRLTPCTVPTLHVYGLADQLITTADSRALLQYYRNPRIHEHEGGHHVPMRAASIQEYESFIQSVTVDARTDEKVDYRTDNTKSTNGDKEAKRNSQDANVSEPEPDEETRQLQQDEVEALTAIFPDEIHLISRRKSGCTEAVEEDNNTSGEDDGTMDNDYEFPICYRIDLKPVDDDAEGLWPPHPIAIQVQYPFNYPQETLPTFKLIHDNNVMQFSTAQAEALVNVMIDAGREEEGMPCVMSCIYAAREFFESGAVGDVVSMTPTTPAPVQQEETTLAKDDPIDSKVTGESSSPGLIQSSTREAIHECNLQGLSIAESVLQQMGSLLAKGDADGDFVHGKGGHWIYTIGLVGKPSAGEDFEIE